VSRCYAIFLFTLFIAKITLIKIKIMAKMGEICYGKQAGSGWKKRAGEVSWFGSVGVGERMGLVG